MSPDDAVAIWEYVRENERRWERAEVCNDGLKAVYSDPDPLKLAPIIGLYHETFPEVEFTIHWRRCGEENAYYDEGSHRIVMCSELLPHGGSLVRFVLAHELAHAVIMQRNVPFTGLHETAADELATLVMIVLGRQEDVKTYAKYLLTLKNDLPPEAPYAEHDARSHALNRIIDGSNRNTAEWQRLTWAWLTILGV